VTRTRTRPQAARAFEGPSPLRGFTPSSSAVALARCHPQSAVLDEHEVAERRRTASYMAAPHFFYERGSIFGRSTARSPVWKVRPVMKPPCVCSKRSSLLTLSRSPCRSRAVPLSRTLSPRFSRSANQSFSAVARAGGVGREPILLLLGGAHNHRRARRVLAVRIEAVLAANARRAEAAPRRVRGVAVMGVGPDLQHTCGRRRCERSARETWRVMGNV
jgi:hypothetical protein